MPQQDQAREYFSAFARDWQTKSESAGYNVIAACNASVLRALAGRSGRFLDIGCGTGQLVIDASRLGLESVGVDFAKEMIDQCDANQSAAGVDAKFVHASAFDIEAAPASYDVISAQGFIEYISPEQTDEFFRRCATMLRPGGELIVGSRNRLFNAVSFNDFTEIELRLGIVGQLVEESVEIHRAKTQAEMFARLREVERIYPQPESHPGTGIDVDVRFQYSPAELAKRVRDCGLTPKVVSPIHFHGLPLPIKAQRGSLHSDLAILVEGFDPDDHRLIPFCSSFTLRAEKAT